jgi:putative ABC transport system permease protein
MRALRALRSRPGFAAAAVATLALGLGVNAAIFSMTRDVLLRPLPYRDAGRLVAIYEAIASQGQALAPIVPANYAAWRGRIDALETTAGYRAVDYNLSGLDAAVRVKGFRVEPSFFPLLGVQPALGRGFADADGRPGHDDVVLLSDGFWRRRFGGDPAAVGRRIGVDGTPCTIVGVLPASFRIYRVLNRELDLWRPFVIDPSDREHSMLVYGRLRPGASVDAARAQLVAAYAALPTHAEGWTADIALMSERFAANSRPILVMLQWAVGLVLLIACANVANLFLAVAAGRRKELAVRSALGASRWRIARDLAGETLLLAAAGTLVAIVLAVWGVALLNGVVSFQHINRLEPFRVDVAVVAFTASLAALVAIAFSILPARQAAATDIVDALKESAHGASTGVSSRRLRHALIVGEIALSIVLASAALALTRSARALEGMNRGVDTERVMTAQLALNGPAYDDAQRMTRFAEALLRRIETAPGIVSASLVNYAPLSVIGTAVPVTVDGRPEAPGREPYAQYWIVAPRYFSTLGIPLVAGREFTAADTSDALPVAIVSRRFAQRFWGSRDAIGRQVTALFGSQSDAVWIPRTVRRPLTIVGIAGDVREDGIPGFVDDRAPQLYLPYMQNPTRIITVVVRTASGPHAAAPIIRDAVRAADPDQPTFDERSLDDVRRNTFARPREIAWLVGSFAALALGLAGVGVYGVMAYLTTARAQEIGIRVALGASRADVVRLIVGDAMKLAAWGVAIGLALVPLATGFARTMLFGVAVADPRILAVVAALVTLVAAAAAAIPAHRAAMAASASFR